MEDEEKSILEEIQLNEKNHPLIDLKILVLCVVAIGLYRFSLGDDALKEIRPNESEAIDFVEKILTENELLRIVAFEMTEQIMETLSGATAKYENWIHQN